MNENYDFFLSIYHKIGWCQQVGYYFTVNHNLPTVDHDLPSSPYHCSFLYTQSVDHNWRRVDHDLPCLHFCSKNIVFFTFVIVHERSIIIYLPHQSLTFFTKKLKRISVIEQVYVRYPYQNCIILFKTFHWLVFLKNVSTLTSPRENKYDKFARTLVERSTYTQKVRRQCHRALKKTGEDPCRRPSEL